MRHSTTSVILRSRLLLHCFRNSLVPRTAGISDGQRDDSSHWFGPLPGRSPGAIDRFSPAILLVQGVDRICQPQMDEMWPYRWSQWSRSICSKQARAAQMGVPQSL